MSKEFEVKALGRLKYFAGIEVAQTSKGIFISQQKYVLDLLKDTSKMACKLIAIAINPNLKLRQDEEDVAVDREMYQCLVGKLIYLIRNQT